MELTSTFLLYKGLVHHRILNIEKTMYFKGRGGGSMGWSGFKTPKNKSPKTKSPITKRPMQHNDKCSGGGERMQAGFQVREEKEVIQDGI